MGTRIKHRAVQNYDWSLFKNDDGTVSHEQVRLAVLMDIREYPREIHVSLLPLRCGNFTRIPKKLDRIGLNTEKLLKGK